MSDMLTNAELDAIEERWRHTTPGPWAWVPELGQILVADRDSGDAVLDDTGNCEDRDMEAMAAARVDVPRLVAALTEARRERDLARQCAGCRYATFGGGDPKCANRETAFSERHGYQPCSHREEHAAAPVAPSGGPRPYTPQELDALEARVEAMRGEAHVPLVRDQLRRFVATVRAAWRERDRLRRGVGHIDSVLLGVINGAAGARGVAEALTQEGR